MESAGKHLSTSDFAAQQISEILADPTVQSRIVIEQQESNSDWRPVIGGVVAGLIVAGSTWLAARHPPEPAPRSDTSTELATESRQRPAEETAPNAVEVATPEFSPTAAVVGDPVHPASPVTVPPAAGSTAAKEPTALLPTVQPPPEDSVPARTDEDVPPATEPNEEHANTEEPTGETEHADVSDDETPSSKSPDQPSDSEKESLARGRNQKETGSRPPAQDESTSNGKTTKESKKTASPNGSSTKNAAKETDPEPERKPAHDGFLH
jgi:hypothetical protein